MRVRSYKYLLLVLTVAIVSVFAKPARAETQQLFGPTLFGRTPSQLFNLGGIGANFDLRFGFPQDVAGFSRLSNPVIANNVEANRRVLIRDPRSGFVVREARLNDFGFLESRPTDAFGRPLSRFFSLNGLDTEAAREASKFFLESNALGSFNNIADLFNGNVNFRDVFAANALAARSMGPDVTRGNVKIQCLKDDAYGRPTDLLAGQLNATEAGKKVDPAYTSLDWRKRCLATVSYAMNLLVDSSHPAIPFNENMIDPNTGILTIPNLRNHFSLRDLSVIFNRANNTDICNNDPQGFNPPFSVEDIVRTSMDPKIVNTVKGFDPDDVNRNFLLTAGVNMALPDNLLGRVGAPKTDEFYIDNKDSGVATSEQTRKILAFNNGAVNFFTTLDTNSSVSGPLTGAQNVRQTGRNNVGYNQSETIWYLPDGRIEMALAVAPDAQGRLKLAQEAPATAAHAGNKTGITTGMCIKCHANGPAMLEQKGGPYDILPVAGSSGIQNLSGNFMQARLKYQGFLKRTNAWVADAKDPNSAKPVVWDAFERSLLPKSQAYVSGLIGWPPQAVAELLRRNPQYKAFLQPTPEGDLNSVNLLAGGKCFLKGALKREFGSPQAFGQSVAPPALAATNAPAGTHVQ